jgi:hypothetical protein
MLNLRVVNPLERRTTILGPRYMEAGKTYRFTAQFNEYRTELNATYALKGYWSLPDGTRVDGTELDYTPQASDEALSFYTYLEGHPEETDVVTKSFRIWQYIWPEQWNIALKPKYLDVPAIIYYRLSATDVDRISRATHGEEIYYNWIVPANVEHRPRDDYSGYFVITEQGDYQVGVEISDQRGNLVNVTSNQFSILPAAQVELESNVWSRHTDATGNYIYYAPGEYSFRIDVTEMPRDDRLTSKELYINGNFIGSFSRTLPYEFEQPGDYDVRYVVRTEMGNVGELNETFTLVEPPRPSCTMSYTSSSSGRYLYLVPDCDVSEGYVQTFSWTYTYEGYDQQSGRDTLTMRASHCQARSYDDISLTVTTNLGGTVTYQDIPYADRCP